MKILLLAILCLYSFSTAYSQFPARKFSAGFDAKECDELLALNVAFLDTTKADNFNGFQSGYKFLYRSQNIGLDNAWDLWVREDSTIVILLRGTTANPKSILADFYCAMMPAKGQVRLANNKNITYHLADDERAAVHAGFLIGFSYLSDDIAPKLDSLYKNGYYNYLIAGHSQGGSLCYLISSWMLHLKKSERYPLLQIKTYASAPPKVGNMYFAYDYDNLTRDGWAFSIVNSGDPVPEMPFTTQQVDIDMNEPNPILDMIKRFDNLPFFKRIMLKRAFRKMIKYSSKSSQSYQKYLGGYAGGVMNSMLPGLQLPEAVNTTYFVRPGTPITLLVNNQYFDYFKVNDGVYYHHGITPYRFLLRQYYGGLMALK